MIKSLIAANNSEKEKFTIPRSVQQSIPIKKIYSDGIWQVGNKHSRTWRFADVNYAAASDEDRRAIFLSYGSVLNALPTDAAAKINIINRRLNPVDFRHRVLMQERGDPLDPYRQEYNDILTGKAAESNNLVQEKYITLSIAQKKIEDTRAYFRRVDSNLSKNFGKLDSGARAISNFERLRLLHDFFRPGEEQYFTFDQGEAIRKGIDFRDLICPDGLQFKADHFEMGAKFGRVLFLKEYASYIKDEMIADLSDFARNLVIAIDILPVPTDEAVKEIQQRILGVESDITRWQQRQNSKNNFTASVPYELEQLRAETKEFLDDLTVRDQRMMFAVVTLVHVADTLEQLDADTETLLAIGREHLCQFATLRYQQEDGLNTVLPYGLRRIKAQQMGAGRITGSHKSIIDRCTANIYRPFLKAKGKFPAPLLTDWRAEVMKQTDPEDREIALAAELITEGSLNVFAHATNVDMDNRLVVLDLYEMGESLRPTALVVTLEAIQNRVAANRRKGKYTWIFIDEVYLYFKYHYSAEVLYRAWKRWRKYGAPLTAATQNVEECLRSETARLMFANSEFLLLFNQAATDRAELAQLLYLSDTQMGYIENAEAGHGRGTGALCEHHTQGYGPLQTYDYYAGGILVLTLGSLFDGIGVFPLAARLNGIEPVWASEILKAPVSITKRHFPDMVHLGDITLLDGGKIPPVDIITFGSPCQNFSQIGDRSGLAGKKSSLFFQAMRIINEMREATDNKYPRIVIFENVMGLLSSGNRMDFRTVLEAFADTKIPMPDSGFWGTAGLVRGRCPDIAWRLLDAQYWARPQLARRQRVFAVADFGGRRVAEILFKPRPVQPVFADSRSSGVPSAQGDRGPFLEATGQVSIIRPFQMRRMRGAAQAQNRTQFIGSFGKSSDPFPTLVASKCAPSELECERLMGLPEGWTKFGALGEERRWVVNLAQLGPQ